MTFRKIDAFTLNGMALNQNTKFIDTFSYLPEDEKHIYEIQQQVEYEVLVRTFSFALKQYNITEYDNPDAYWAALEMISSFMFDIDALNEQYDFNSFKEYIDITAFIISRMLNKIEDEKDRLNTLMATKAFIPELEDNINFAIQNPDMFIFRTVEAMSYIRENLAIKEAEELIEDTRKLKIAHILEELVEDGMIPIKSTDISSYVEYINNYQKDASGIAGHDIQLSRLEIINLFRY